VDENTLHSIVLDLQVKNHAVVPTAMGPRVHALFHQLINQFDPALSTRLHIRPGYRPFTVSLLSGVLSEGKCVVFHNGQLCRLRITLFDSGQIWHGLRRHFLEAGPIFVHVGGAKMQLIRILSTPSTDPTGWVRSTDWSTLVRLPPKRVITFHFASPTAFNMGNRHFELLPEPTFVWESLLRVWNTYAPACFQFEKQELRESVERQIDVVKSDLYTETLLFSEYTQKGFLGTCQYVIHDHAMVAPQLTTLAAFAYYAGVGYKTTMGMGQVQIEFDDALAKPGANCPQANG